MSTNENMAVPEEPSLAPTLALRQPAIVGHPMSGGFAGMPTFAPEAGKGVNLFVYLHAVRRHWVLALSTSLLAAAVLAPAVWFVRGAKYTANAALQVLPSQQHLVVETVADKQNAMTTPEVYMMFKETQAQMLKSRLVIEAALRDSKVGSLPSVKEQLQSDPYAWLQKELQVVPAKSHLLHVAITLPNANDAALLVNGVVEAYIKEVVGKARDARNARLAQLDTLCEQNETKVRQKRTDVKNLADQLKCSPNPDALSFQQQAVLQHYSLQRDNLTRVNFELARMESHLKAIRDLKEQLREAKISDGEVLNEMYRDAQGRDVAERLIALQMNREVVVNNTVAGRNASVLAKLDRDIGTVQNQYNALGNDVRTRIAEMRDSKLDENIRQLQSEVASLMQVQKKCAADVEEARKEAQMVGGKSIELEMLNEEVKQISRMLSLIAEERERLRVEQNNAPQITVAWPAKVPDSESGRMVRFALAAIAGLAGLFLPVAGIVWWDTRAERINAVAEVSKGLGLPVIGSMPQIPTRVIRQLGAPTKRNQTWRARLTEAVDSMAARLLRRAELEESRVLLITSAMAGEGKTTLAAQLAMSLSRNLRRTVLVDCDLRRPALGGVFGLPLEPGVCEALRGEGDAAGMVHPTESEYLSVMTAGRWDRQAMAALANGAAEPLLARLREEFEFVILDSSPVLPIADTRFISQHVDGVILSVFRDVSEAPKVQAACEILEAFGVRTLEAVVTGGQEHMYGKNSEYESASPAEAKP